MFFGGDRFASLALPTAVVWFIDEIAEASRAFNQMASLRSQ